MKIKVDDIKPGLPGETLRNINKWIYLNFDGGIVEKGLYAYTHYDGETRMWISKIPDYCTSIGDALGLCRKMYIHMEITLWGDGEASVELVEHQTKTEKVSIAELCGGRGLSDIPCAVVRALLRSRNVNEIQI